MTAAGHPCTTMVTGPTDVPARRWQQEVPTQRRCAELPVGRRRLDRPDRRHVESAGRHAELEDGAWLNLVGLQGDGGVKPAELEGGGGCVIGLEGGSGLRRDQ
jgi:hypothetical protein